MKNFKFALVALMLMCTCQTFAQKAIKDMTDKELSEYFALKVNQIKAEMKVIKVQLKADQTNGELNNQLITKQAELENAKNNKKIIDNAIKASSKYDKTIKAAEAAEKKAKQAADKAVEARKKAEEMKKKAEEAIRNTLFLRQ